MYPNGMDQEHEKLELMRRQTLRLDQIRVMLGVLVGVGLLFTLVFLVSITS